MTGDGLCYVQNAAKTLKNKVLIRYQKTFKKIEICG